jgi:foldase protein PrsA
MKLHYRVALIALVVVLAAVFFGAGCGRKGKVVVTVNKEGIDRDLFIRRLERAYGGTVLNGMVQEVLTLQYAEKNKLLPTEAEVNTELEARKKAVKEEEKKDWQDYLKQRDETEEELKDEIRAYLASFNIATKGVKVTDKEVKQFYDNMVAARQPPFYMYEQIHLFHIETASKETIDKAYDMLKKGASWATVAMQMSESSDKNSSGDMSWAIVDEDHRAIGFVTQRAPQPLRPFPPEIEKKILAIPVGRYSEPMPVKLFGGPTQTWQIFRVTERNDQKTASYKDAKEQAKRLLMQSKARDNETAQKELENYQKFIREAKIKAFDEKYTNVQK